MRLRGPRPQREPLVLGAERAAAHAADESHRQHHGDGPSPLEGARYDTALGELDLHRLVTSDTDAAVARLMATVDAGNVAQLRSRLRIDDFYTLLAFSHRQVIVALREGHARALGDAIVALSLLDAERMDWRDAATSVELVAWAFARLGTDHAAALERAISRSQGAIAEMLADVARRRARKLSAGMWAPIATPDGPALAQADGDPYKPTVDLVAVAFELQRAIEADAYRVSSLTVESELPGVWLVPSGGLETALKRIRACVTITAELDAARDPGNAQMFIVFLVETTSPEGARLVSEAAVPARGRQVLGVAAGALCAVTVARSVVVGVPGFEEDGALQRFAEPFGTALRGA